jgi:predicted RNase H-like HicB family nuclease
LNTQFVLSEFIERALDGAEYEKLDDGTYSGSIPLCAGVIAFARSLRDCERELRSVLEDWLLLGLKMGHDLPIIAGIDLNDRVPEDLARGEAIRQGLRTGRATREDVFRHLR